MSLKSKGGLQLLQEEKQRLRAECKNSEERLLTKFEELKKEYPRLLTDAILPFESSTNKSVGDGLGMLNSLLFSKVGSIFKDKPHTGVWLKLGMQVAQLFTIRGVYNWFSKKKEPKD